MQGDVRFSIFIGKPEVCNVHVVYFVFQEEIPMVWHVGTVWNTNDHITNLYGYLVKQILITVDLKLFSIQKTLSKRGQMTTNFLF